jgi:hypothetical protein
MPDCSGPCRPDLFDDGVRIFAARIVAGDQHVVGCLRDLAHLRTLARIAVAAAAEHAPQLAAAVGRHWRSAARVFSSASGVCA